MKTLHLIRHAKSDRPTPGIPDIERELNGKGRLDATDMGRRFSESAEVPGIFLTSPAVRATTTARLFVEGTGAQDVDIRVIPALYATGAEGIIEAVESIPDAVDAVALVCHNPDVTRAANRLGSISIDHMPTCCVVTIRFATRSWSDIAGGSGETVSFDYPKKARG